MQYPTALLNYFKMIKENFENLEAIDYEYVPPEINYDNPNSYEDVNITKDEYAEAYKEKQAKHPFGDGSKRYLFDTEDSAKIMEDKDSFLKNDNSSPDYDRAHIHNHEDDEKEDSHESPTSLNNVDAKDAKDDKDDKDDTDDTEDKDDNDDKRKRNLRKKIKRYLDHQKDYHNQFPPDAEHEKLHFEVDFNDKDLDYRKVLTKLEEHDKYHIKETENRNKKPEEKKEEDKKPEEKKEEDKKKEEVVCDMSDIFDMNCNKTLKIMIWTIIAICIFVLLGVFVYIVYSIFNYNKNQNQYPAYIKQS